MRIDQRLLLFLRSVREADEKRYIPTILFAVGLLFILAFSYLCAYFSVVNKLFDDIFNNCTDCVHSITFLVWILGIMLFGLIGGLILMVVESIRYYVNGGRAVDTPCGFCAIFILMGFGVLAFMIGLSLVNTFLFSAYYPKTDKDMEHFFISLTIGYCEMLVVILTIVFVKCFKTFCARSYEIYNDKIGI